MFRDDDLERALVLMISHHVSALVSPRPSGCGYATVVSPIRRLQGSPTTSSRVQRQVRILHSPRLLVTMSPYSHTVLYAVAGAHGGGHTLRPALLKSLFLPPTLTKGRSM